MDKELYAKERIAEAKLPKKVIELCKLFKKNNFQLYLVGGSVRDILSAKVPHDYDLTTDATPEEMMSFLNVNGVQIIPSGLKFGTITVLFDDKETFEITTFRNEGRYLDNRHPDVIEYSKTLSEDLKRRDFTINAMAIDPLNKTYIDLFDGLDDLNDHIIRAIGEPDERFNEDALRIVRAFRFACKLDFEIEKNTLESMYKNLDLLDGISKERIKDEIIKMIVPTSHSFTKAYKKYPFILEKIIPEMKKMHVSQNNYYHVYDVSMHSLLTYENNPTDDYQIALASLFHDIGKPYTITEEKGLNHFYKHEHVGKEIVTEILKRLKFSSKAIHYISFLIFYHMYYLNPTKRIVKRLLYKVDMEFPNEDTLKIVKDIIDLQRADVKSQNPDLISERLQQFDEFEKVLAEVIKENEAFSLKDLAIDGYDVLSIGLTGKNVGVALEKALEKVMQNELKNDKKILIDYVKTLEF